MIAGGKEAREKCSVYVAFIILLSVMQEALKL